MDAAATPSTKRRSRWSRDGHARAHLTARDIEIFKLLNRYRYLRSDFIHAFIGGDRTKLIERLGLLYRNPNRYVDRPVQQRQCADANYRPLIYELTARGEDALRQHGQYSDGDVAPLRRGDSHTQFAHAATICEALASIDLGTKSGTALRFITWPEIIRHPRFPANTQQLKNPVQLPCSISYRPTLSSEQQRFDGPFMPDAVFGIEYGSGDHKSWRFFALEVDRGTEPVERANLEQTSYLRKLLQYRDAISRGTYRTQWGVPNLLVLNATTDERRMGELIKLAADLTQGAGCPYLLFKTLPTLGGFQPPAPATPHLLTEPWHRVGHEPFDISKP